MSHHRAFAISQPMRLTAQAGAGLLVTTVADFLYNDNTSREDVCMTSTPTPEEQPQRMTITQIAALLGRSRQLIHRLATTDEAFPEPVIEAGSTRPKYDRAAVEEWWASREVRQGRRTDLEKARDPEQE